MSHGGHHSHFHGRRTNGFTAGSGPGNHHYIVHGLYVLYALAFVRDFLYRPFIGHPITAGAIAWGVVLTITIIGGSIWYRRTR